MKGHWNQRYAENEAAYGKKPNAFFKHSLKNLEPGSMLLPCDGEGRNAVYAAENGWDVVSFDFSESGVAKARVWAKEAGVKIECTQEDAFEFEPSKKFDSVVLVFSHMSPDRIAEFHARAISWLKDGGTLILEGFSKNQLGKNSGGPKMLEMLFDRNMLEEHFSDMEIVSLEEVNQMLDEGPFHQGEASTIQLIARKPVH